MARAAIIIPAYNAARFIHRAIESSVNQTERDIEIIIIDDGSTDATASVIVQYAQEDPRIIFASQSNSGVSSARNHGIELANADYLLFLDADDWLEENAVEQLLAHLQPESTKLVCAECYYVQQAEDGTMMREYQGDHSPEIVLDKEESLHCVGKHNRFKLTSSCYRLYSAQIIKNNGLRFNENIHYGEDGVFVFQYLCMADGISYFSAPLWNILDRPGSATHSAYSAKWLTGIEAVDLMLKQEGLDRETKTNLLSMKATRAMLVQMVAIRTPGAPVEDIRYARKVLRENAYYKIRESERVKLILEIVALTTLPIWLLRILLKK